MSVSGDDLGIGAVIDGYRLEERLGEGPTGVVYRASRSGLDDDVAVKAVHDDVLEDLEYRERIEREIHVAARLDHPGLVPILDFGDDDGVRYVATKYVRGRDLGRLLTRVGRVDAAQTLSILRRVASALDAAHASGLIHGSVKPSNVIIAELSASERAGYVYVTDLAVARGVSEVARNAGRPVAIAYASPEQIEGDPLTRATDQYGLACLAYACLTGRPPFSRERDSAVMMAILLEAPPSARTLVDDLPESTDGVFERALAKSPGQRFPTCSEFVEELALASTSQLAAPARQPRPVADVQTPHSAPGSMETEFRFGAVRDSPVQPGTTEFAPKPRADVAHSGSAPVASPPSTPKVSVPPPAFVPESPQESPAPPPASPDESVQPGGRRPPSPSSPKPAPSASQAGGTELTPPARDPAVTPVTERRSPDAPTSPDEGERRKHGLVGAQWLGQRRRIVALAAGGVVALGVGVTVGSAVGGRDSGTGASPAPRTDNLGEFSSSQRHTIPLRRLLKNDGEGLTVVGLAGGEGVHGGLKLQGTTLVFTPDGGYGGPVRFTYTVKDADGALGVAAVTARVKGLSSAQKGLVALVSSAARRSCVAGKSSREIRCDSQVGEIVLRRYPTGRDASDAFANRFRGGEGSCESAAATGQWNWPRASASRAQFGCSTAGGKPSFGWTYPSSGSTTNALAVVTGKRGAPLGRIRAWFFERSRLPMPGV